jgi:hypothetical protein
MKLWGLGVIFRYNLAQVEACKTIGAKISTSGDSKGYLQNAITPPSSTKLTALTWALILVLFAYAFWTSGWAATGIAVGTFVVAAGIFFIPKPESMHFLMRVSRSMASRHADYAKEGDLIRSNAMKNLFDRFTQVYGDRL